MPSSETWRHVGLVKADVSEERVTYVFKVERIRELGTLAVSRRLDHTVKNGGMWDSLQETFRRTCRPIFRVERISMVGMKCCSVC
jgi:hypothetical protein